MKVDPNQNICAYQQNYVENTPEHEFGVDRVKTVGGIPLRLELAARFMAAEITNPKADYFWNDKALIALDAADALIEVHNATCEVKNGE